MRQALRLGLSLLVLSGALYLFVYPARTYLEQRQEISSVEQTLSVLRNANARLTTRYAQLQQLPYIEQLARAEYGLVLPGQQAFTVLPAPAEALPAEHRTVPARRAARSPGTAPWYAPLEFWDHF